MHQYRRVIKTVDLSFLSILCLYSHYKEWNTLKIPVPIDYFLAA